MREVTRLALLGIVSCLVVGGAIVYSRDGYFNAIAAPLLNGVSVLAEAEAEDAPAEIDIEDEPAKIWEAGNLAALRTRAVDPEEPVQQTRNPSNVLRKADPQHDALYTLTIPRPQRNTWMGLAGFPDRTSVRFPLPSGLDAHKGDLHLVILSEIAEDGDGRLSVAVNGRQRGEVVLNEGYTEHKVDVTVSREDLLGTYLEVELAAQGTTTGGQICPTNAVNSGAAITLTEQSTLTLSTASPAEGGEVIVATMPQPLGIRLGDTVLEQARSIGLAHYLSRRGIESVFSDNSVSPALELFLDTDEPIATRDDNVVVVGGAAGLHRVAALRASKPELVGWPAPAGDLGATTTEVDFRGKRRWRLQYDLAGLESGMVPAAIEVALKTGPLTSGSDWLAHVSLNGHLLMSRRLDGQADVARWSVPLPADIQTLTNTLDIELIDTSPSEEVCEARLSVKAQLLPETRLLMGTEQPQAGWARMVRALANADALGLEVDSLLSLSQAMRATAMLNQFVPARADMRFGKDTGTDDVQLSVTTAIRLKDALALANRMSRNGGDTVEGLWLVLPGGPSASLSLHDAGVEDIATVLNQLGPEDVVIAIWAGAGSSRV